MRFIIALVGFSILLTRPVFAQDIFTDFETGTWGYSGVPVFRCSGVPELSCEGNPHTIQFSPDHTRATFVWPNPMTNYLRQRATRGDYSVTSHDNGNIIMAMDKETRQTPQGDPVVWVLKKLPGDMYCWGRTDWPPTGCIAVHVRCPELPPIS